MKNLHFFIVLLLLSLGSITLLGQVSTPRSQLGNGGEYVGSNHTINWSFGEVFTETITGPIHAATQGFHQPHLLTVCPEPILVTDSLINTSCNGSSDGSISLNATGGRGNLSFIWSNGDTTETLLSLTAGSYTVTISDRNDCSVSHQYLIGEPMPIVAAFTATGADNVHASNGSVVLDSIYGGTGSYAFAWSNGQTTADISGLTGGTYTVTITDNSGCPLIESVSVNPWAFTPTGENHSVYVEPTTAIVDVNEVALANGDLLGAFYELNGNEFCAGYTVWNDSFPMVFPVFGNDETPPLKNGFNVGERFTWKTWQRSLSVESDVIVGYLPAGSLSGIITHRELYANDGFSGLDSITTGCLLDLTTQVTHLQCHADSSGAIDLSPSGGTAPLGFAWSTGDTAEDLSGLQAGTYLVSVSDANGCELSDTFVVNQPDALSLSAEVVPVSGAGNGDGAIDLTVTGGTPPYQFLWTTGATTEDLSGLPEASYTVAVSDGLGCVITAVYEVSFECNAPSILTSYGITDRSVKLSWNCEPDAFSYEIRGNAVGRTGYRYLNLAPGCPNFKSVPGLAPNTSYFWQVRKVCDQNNTVLSSWSVIDTFATLCSKPENNDHTLISPERAILFWEEVIGSQGYEVQGRQLGSQRWLSISLGNVTLFDARNLSPNTSYEWRVRAFCDESGNTYSTFSAKDTLTTFSLKNAGSGLVDSGPNLFNGDLDVRVFPNPNEGSFYVDLKRFEERQTDFMLFDLLGKEIQLEIAQESTANRYKMFVKNPQAGTYFLQIKTGGLQRILKFVITD